MRSKYKLGCHSHVHLFLSFYAVVLLIVWNHFKCILSIYVYICMFVYVCVCVLYSVTSDSSGYHVL